MMTQEQLETLRSRYDGKFTLIAYSVTDNPEGHTINTREMYAYNARHGYDMIKGDVRITADGVLVMCHDAGFTLDENGFITKFNKDNNIPIRSMTWAQVSALRYAAGNQSRVAVLEDMVKVCKRYGVDAFITIRNEFLDEIMPQVLALIAKYDFHEHCILNTVTREVAPVMRSYDPEIMLCWTSSAPAEKENIDFCDSLGNCCFGPFLLRPHFSDEKCRGIMEDMTEVLQYAKEKGVRIIPAQSRGGKNLDMLLAYGVTAVQTFGYWAD